MVHLLFPKEPIDFASSPREGEKDVCPHCGERRVTNCIHGFVTFLCGSSRFLGGSTTPCQGIYFQSFIVN